MKVITVAVADTPLDVGDMHDAPLVHDIETQSAAKGITSASHAVVAPELAVQCP